MYGIIYNIELNWILRLLGRMDDDRINWWTEKVGGNGRTTRKPTHTVFVHHKAHMAWAGMELTTLSTRGERSTQPPRPLIYLYISLVT